MKKENRIRMCCLLLSLLLVIGLVGCGDEKAPESYTYTQSETWVLTETDDLQISIEKEILEDENDRNWAVYHLEQAYREALTFLGDGYAQEEKLRCCIYAGDGLTQISEETLEIFYYDTVEQPYTNYMIQALAGIQVPDWMREGLAAYGADLSRESLLESYGKNLSELDCLRAEKDEEKVEYAGVSALARILYETGSFEEVLELGDLMKIMSQKETAEEADRCRAAYCIFAGSFVQYLTETEGLEAVLRIYNGEEFKSVMGKKFTTMHKEWIEWIALPLESE